MANKLNDLTGKRFSRLTVLSRAENRNGATMWHCKCDCGNYKDIRSCSLISGETKSCGCLKKETLERLNSRDDTKKRLYSIWRSMKKRCYQKTSSGYSMYGGRGITVCDEWKNSFKNFEKWALQNGYNDSLTIDRIDNDKNYNPYNCRFSTYLEQENNKRNNRKITYNDVTLNVSQWCRITNTPPSTFHNRLYKHGEKFAVEKSLQEFRERVIE